MAVERLCPCEFLVPVAYNDGREVEPEVMTKITQVLNRQFGAWTIGGIRQGHWEGQTEDSISFQIALPEADVPRLQSVVRAIGMELEQKAMYFAAGPPSVDIIEIDPGNDPSFSKFLF